MLQKTLGMEMPKAKKTGTTICGLVYKVYIIPLPTLSSDDLIFSRTVLYWELIQGLLQDP